MDTLGPGHLFTADGLVLEAICRCAIIFNKRFVEYDGTRVFFQCVVYCAQGYYSLKSFRRPFSGICSVVVSTHSPVLPERFLVSGLKTFLYLPSAIQTSSMIHIVEQLGCVRILMKIHMLFVCFFLAANMDGDKVAQIQKWWHPSLPLFSSVFTLPCMDTGTLRRFASQNMWVVANQVHLWINLHALRLGLEVAGKSSQQCVTVKHTQGDFLNGTCGERHCFNIFFKTYCTHWKWIHHRSSTLVGLQWGNKRVHPGSKILISPSAVWEVDVSTS